MKGFNPTRGGKRNRRHRGLGAAPTSIFTAFLALLLLPIFSTPAAEIPHVTTTAKTSYTDEYRYAIPHKAYAIAPGGSWSWRSGRVDAETASGEAIKACEEHTAQPCVVYDLDGQVVFDEKRWPTLWRPYPTREEAAARPIGTGHGNRFPDLAFHDREGHPKSLTDFRGKVVILHFWGSWCPPCMREFPELLQFQSELRQQLGEQVVLVLLQAREPFAASLRWAKRNEFGQLPLYDSGIGDEEHTTFTTTDGQSITDRQLAPVFPTSYILDRNGITLFRHKGPIDRWNEYLPFLRDAVNHAARR
ncbi:TlpA family protein disulfide reductase [Endothiovibrio diazotrophicus]